MARPHMNPEDRKHPHRPRRSTTIGEQYDIPEPSKALKKQWKWLVDLAESVVLSMPATSNHTAKKLRISLRHAPKSGKMPKGFPRGDLLIAHEDGSTVKSYNCELLLLWLWQMKLAPRNPSMLYAMRRKLLLGLTGIEKELEITLDEDVEEEYNVVIEADNEGEE